MSISYEFAKLNARIIENSQNFKHYIESHLFEYKGIMGFSIVDMLIFNGKENNKVEPKSLDNKGRYLGFHNAADWTLGVTLGSIVLGATDGIVSIIFFRVVLYSIYINTRRLSILVCITKIN